MKKKSARKSAFFNPRALIGFIFCLAAVFMALAGAGIYPNLSKAQAQPALASAQPASINSPGGPAVVRMVGPVRLDQDLRSLPYIPPREKSEERRLTRHPFPLTGPHGPTGSAKASPFAQYNSLIKRFVPNMPPPFQTFEGQGNTCSCQPSDSEGDVGPNHYVEAATPSPVQPHTIHSLPA
jgi:hypothetical protein